MNRLLKIVAMGPESTGKSTLCRQLAEYYNTLWCPEYAREYLLTNGVNYTYDDLLTIAKGQLALEDEYELKVDVRRETTDVKNRELDNNQPAYYSPLGGGGSLLFIDTDMYIMKVWCEYVFHKCHPYILEQITTRKYDLYLLCNPDLPWEPDALREYPDEESRLQLYGIYKNLLLHQQTPFIEITGNYYERLQKAIQAVNELLIARKLRSGA